jgi:hypothetical protein
LSVTGTTTPRIHGTLSVAMYDTAFTRSLPTPPKGGPRWLNEQFVIRMIEFQPTKKHNIQRERHSKGEQAVGWARFHRECALCKPLKVFSLTF